MSFPFYTFGGLFYWIDRYNYFGWRIQESMWTRRCRLLDPFSIKRGSGSFQECYDKLQEFLRMWEINTDSKKAAVVLVHGLFQRPNSFDKMARKLKKDFEPVLFSYPMFRFSLMKSAQVLNDMLNRRQDLKQINFIAYGMGGLIVRQAIALNPAWLDRLGRTVFMAVPHQGYFWLEKVKDKKWYPFLLNKAGQNLLPETAKALPAMTGEFGVITGGKEDDKGFLPWLKEDNDGILIVKDARCEGAKDEFMALNRTHFFLHWNDKLITMAQNFLKTGRFGRGVRIRKDQSYTNLWDK